MADIDLGALKYKIGLDTSGLEKQLKETEDKLKNSVSHQLSFKVAATELSGVNNQLGEMLKKILEANKQSAKIGNSGKKELPIEKQIDRLSKKLNSAAAKYEILRVKQNATFESGANDSSVKKMDRQLEHMSNNIKKMQAEYIRLNDVFKSRQVEVPQTSIASERELNLLRRQYELEQAQTKEIAKQNAERERASRKMQADQSKYLTYLSGQSGLAIGMPEDSANDISKKIDAIETRLKALNQFKAKVSVDSNQAVRADAVIQRLQGHLDRLRSSMKGQSTADLLNINPTSINQANALIAELTSRRNTLNVTDARYSRTIAQLNKRIQEHNQFISTAQQTGVQLERTNANNAESSKKFSDELGKQNRMMREFVNSIKAYAGFYFFRDIFTELVNIRGEFELQQVSLRAIIQDARKADEIFQQIKGLAVISPFQFKDLVGYTKQLSAFQIPVNELYGTMKSLADVSSGLGVDMGRIILAYGQIRSAGVLRGQELRQLTEAGIPALEELRKKLEQVKGVAITTDDVFTAISKREIPFDYIREMFTNMTKEGGMFYKMQEIQSASLKGMVSNLADAYQLMINDIGEANDGVLKNVVSSLTTLMNNWDTIISAMKGVLVGYGALKLYSIGYTAALGKENAALIESQANTNAKAIASAKAAQSYRLLTDAERQLIAQGKAFNMQNLEQLVSEKKISKEMALQLVYKRQLTASQKEYLVSSGLISKEQLQIAERTKMSRAEILQSTNALKEMDLELQRINMQLAEQKQMGGAGISQQQQKNVQALREQMRVEALMLAQNGKLTASNKRQLSDLGEMVVQRGILTRQEIIELANMRARVSLTDRLIQATERYRAKSEQLRATINSTTGAFARFGITAQAAGYRAMSLTSAAIGKLTTSLRGLGGALVTAAKSIFNWQTAIMAAGFAIWDYYQGIQRAKEALRELNEEASKSFSQAYTDLTENVNKIFEGKSLDNAVDLKNIQSGLTDILKKYGDIGESIILQANMTDDMSERVKILRNGVDNLANAYKNATPLVTAMNVAANTENNIIDDSMVKVAKKYGEYLDEQKMAEIKLVSYKAEYVKYAEKVVTALRKGNDSQNKMADELQSLVDKGGKVVDIYNKIQEARKNATGIALPNTGFSENAQKAYSGLFEANKTLDDYKSTFESKYSEVLRTIEAYIREQNPNIDLNNLTDALKAQVSVAVNQFLNSLEGTTNDTKKEMEKAFNLTFDLPSWRNVIENQIELLSPNQLDRTFLMQLYDDAQSSEEASRSLMTEMYTLKNKMKQAEPNSEEWKSFRGQLELIEQLINRMGWGLANWQKSLKNISGGTIFDGIISSSKDTEEAIGLIAQQYQNAQEAIKKYTDAFAKQGVEIKSITTEFLVSDAFDKLTPDLQNAAKAMAAYNETIQAGNLFKKEGYKIDKETKGGSKTDPEIQRWKERIQLVQSAYDKYVDLVKLVGKESAKIQTENIFGNQAKELQIDLSFDEKQLLASYDKAISGVEARGKAGIAAATKFQIDKGNEAAKLAKERQEKLMKQMVQDFERYRNKYDFYKDILGITGDTDLALDLAIQYTGDASQMAENFASAIYSNLQQAMAGMSLDLGIDVVPDTNSFSSMNSFINKLNNAIQTNENIGENQREELLKISGLWTDYFANLAKQYAQNIANYGDYNEKVKAIMAKYKKDIDTAVGMGNLPLANVLKNSQEAEIYKLSNEYQNFFGAVEAMSLEMAQDVGDKIRQMLLQSFQDGALTAKQYQQELKRVNDQIFKVMRQKSDSRTYLTGGLDAMFDNQIAKYQAQQLAALNDIKKAQADINKYQTEYVNALKEGDEASINIAERNIENARKQEAAAQAAYNQADFLQKAAMNAKQLAGNIGGTISVITNAIGGIQTIVSSISNMIDSLGGDSSSGLMGGINEAVAFLGDVSVGISNAFNSLKNGDIFGAVANVVAMPFNIISGFAQRHDAKLQKRIERMELDVKKLSNVYSILETQMEHSLGADSGLAEAQVKNLKEQLRLQEQMMQAEKDKKKTDEGKMADYRQAIEEMRQQIRYYTEEMANDLYGIDVKGWAQEIGDAIVDAWSKGESAAKAYETTVADIMKNVVKNYLQKQFIEKAMEKVQTSLFGSDGQGGFFADKKLDENEVKQLAAIISSIGASVPEFTGVLDQLEKALNTMGMTLKDTKEKSEGLSNAVEGVTEDTANQLVGYLNGMRAEMIVQSNLLRQIVLLNGGGTEGEGSGPSIQTLQLETLRQQLASINAIRDALSSVITISPTGGSALKAVISN